MSIIVLILVIQIDKYKLFIFLILFTIIQNFEIKVEVNFCIIGIVNF